MAMQGCVRYATDNSSFCVAHGGGKRCQYASCSKPAERSSNLCVAHGTGKRCQLVGCLKAARAATPFCVGHGGGKQCLYTGCHTAARGSNQYCIAHGGGKRCRHLSCNKSAQGRTDLCITHGGGECVPVPDPVSSAPHAITPTVFAVYMPSTAGMNHLSTAVARALARRHALKETVYTRGVHFVDVSHTHALTIGRAGNRFVTGKRCKYTGCPKATHCNGTYCRIHGVLVALAGEVGVPAAEAGAALAEEAASEAAAAARGRAARRCQNPGCNKLARGSTQNCIAHGGGRRCKQAGCAKSAQGTTHYCVAHGGGECVVKPAPVSSAPPRL